jgi:hypothetical protein
VYVVQVRSLVPDFSIASRFPADVSNRCVIKLYAWDRYSLGINPYAASFGALPEWNKVYSNLILECGIQWGDMVLFSVSVVSKTTYSNVYICIVVTL